MAALPLALHERYSRAEIFPTVGINYTPQKPQLNTGLSPQCRDGGFFIFVTLDKEGYPSGQDYGDELYRDKLSWVSRRGVNETQKDYVKLREPETRVSLFVRNNQAEKFVYAGELKYQSHRQVQEKQPRDVQQYYLWSLKESIPEDTLRVLEFGISARRRKASAKKKARRRSNRRPL